MALAALFHAQSDSTLTAAGPHRVVVLSAIDTPGCVWVDRHHPVPSAFLGKQRPFLRKVLFGSVPDHPGERDFLSLRNLLQYHVKLVRKADRCPHGCCVLRVRFTPIPFLQHHDLTFTVFHHTGDAKTSLSSA